MTLIVITGIQAVGKSTVAQLLAESFPRSVHVRGDALRRMIVNDRAQLSAHPTGEAVRQLHLRYGIAAAAASQYADAGFTTVLQDTAIGAHLEVLLGAITHRPLYLIVLTPSPDAVAHRDAERQQNRGKFAYEPGRVEIEQLDTILRTETPRAGYWLDTTHLDPAQTVAQIKTNLDLARLPAEHAVLRPAASRHGLTQGGGWWSRPRL